MKKIDSLTADQKKNIESDRLKRMRNPLDGAKLNPEVAERIFTETYKEIGLAAPIFLYVDSPSQALQLINSRLSLSADTYHYPTHYGVSELDWIEYYRIINRRIDVKFEAEDLARLDRAYDLAMAAGWSYTFSDFVVICDHPASVHFNDEFRLNRINGPAVEFKDGTGVYVFDGVRVPVKFGSTDPKTWDAKEVISFDNVEVRRVLIQVMGYENIMNQLGAKKLDEWREYTLFKVESLISTEEDFVVLKMTCPSTEHVHTLRVPPTSTSARDAAKWVNHGIDPTEFVLEH